MTRSLSLPEKLFTLIVAVPLFLAPILNSACNSKSPLFPPQIQSENSNAVNDSGFYDSHQNWGYWHVVIDGKSGEVLISPMRGIAEHWNVTKFVQAPKCPDCLSITNVKSTGDNLISATVAISHPFTGKPKFDAFDVKGVVLGEPKYEFQSGTVSDVVANPDGYTSRWHLKPGGAWAKINPFLDFAIENPERRFESGGTYQREYFLRLPSSGPLVFDYVIDACWLPPEIVDPDIPALSNHCNEAYCIAYTFSGPIIPLDGSYEKVWIFFKDWQNDGSDADVSVEIPSLSQFPFPAALSYENSSQEFICKVTNENNAQPGTYKALITIRDPLNVPDYDLIVTFQMIEITVSDSVPNLSGIFIEPDTVSLYEKESTAQFEVGGEYGIKSFAPVEGNFKWSVSGTDLNGNSLAEIDSTGQLKRITPKWWGGIASVKVELDSYKAGAFAYCVDPFADGSEVELGAFNKPGDSFTDPDSLLGPPSGMGPYGGSTKVCSLGYGGVAVLEFKNNVIVDGPGPDFIVFENAFFSGGCDIGDKFIDSSWTETAVIEVSKDGVNWFRIPNDYDPSNNVCDIAPYKNPSSFHGLAGVNPVYASVALDGSLKGGVDPTDPVYAGGDSFDLADVGLDWCKFVKLIDTGDWLDAPGTEICDDNGDMIIDAGKMSALGAVPGTAGFDCDSVAAIHSVSPLDINE